MYKRKYRPYRYKRMRVNGKLIDEHRYIMEQHIGRKLMPDEIVHHINNNPKDNRIDNLEITTKSKHAKYHHENGDMVHNPPSKESQHIPPSKKVMILYNQNSLLIVRSQKMAARCTNMSVGDVWRIVNGHKRQIRGFSFRLL